MGLSDLALQLFSQLDFDRDGFLSIHDLQSFAGREQAISLIQQLDRSGSGLLSLSDFSQGLGQFINVSRNQYSPTATSFEDLDNHRPTPSSCTLLSIIADADNTIASTLQSPASALHVKLSPWVSTHQPLVHHIKSPTASWQHSPSMASFGWNRVSDQSISQGRPRLCIPSEANSEDNSSTPAVIYFHPSSSTNNSSKAYLAEQLHQKLEQSGTSLDSFQTQTSNHSCTVQNSYHQRQDFDFSQSSMLCTSSPKMITSRTIFNFGILPEEPSHSLSDQIDASDSDPSEQLHNQKHKSMVDLSWCVSTKNGTLSNQNLSPSSARQRMAMSIEQLALAFSYHIRPFLSCEWSSIRTLIQKFGEFRPDAIPLAVADQFVQSVKQWTTEHRKIPQSEAFSTKVAESFAFALLMHTPIVHSSGVAETASSPASPVFNERYHHRSSCSSSQSIATIELKLQLQRMTQRCEQWRDHAHHVESQQSAAEEKISELEKLLKRSCRDIDELVEEVSLHEEALQRLQRLYSSAQATISELKRDKERLELSNLCLRRDLCDYHDEINQSIRSTDNINSNQGQSDLKFMTLQTRIKLDSTLENPFVQDEDNQSIMSAAERDLLLSNDSVVASLSSPDHSKSTTLSRSTSRDRLFNSSQGFNSPLKSLQVELYEDQNSEVDDDSSANRGPDSTALSRGSPWQRSSIASVASRRRFSVASIESIGEKEHACNVNECSFQSIENDFLSLSALKTRRKSMVSVLCKPSCDEFHSINLMQNLSQTSLIELWVHMQLTLRLLDTSTETTGLPIFEHHVEEDVFNCMSKHFNFQNGHGTSSLAQLINLIAHETIDLRVIHRSSAESTRLSITQQLENAQLIVSSASALGISVSSIQASDLIDLSKFTSSFLLLIGKLIIEWCKTQVLLLVVTRPFANDCFSDVPVESIAVDADKVLTRWLNSKCGCSFESLSKLLTTWEMGAGADANASQNHLMNVVNGHLHLASLKSQSIDLIAPADVWEDVVSYLSGLSKVFSTKKLACSPVSHLQFLFFSLIFIQVESSHSHDKEEKQLRALNEPVKCFDQVANHDFQVDVASLQQAVTATTEISFQAQGDDKNSRHNLQLHRNRMPIMTDAQRAREERALRMWVNSLGLHLPNSEAVQIVNLFEGCRSGLTMLAVIDFLLTTSIQHTEGFVVPWESKVRLECDNKFQRVSNCNIAIDLAQKQPFSCNLVGIAGSDIEARNEKFILSVMWQLMRFHIFSSIKQTARLLQSQTNQENPRIETSQMQPHEGIDDRSFIIWANQCVARVGKKTSIQSLRDSSILDCSFLFDLLYSLQPRIVDWDCISSGCSSEDKLNNARYMLSSARKLGAILFMEPEDVVQGNSRMVLSLLASLCAVDAQRQ